MYDVFYKLTADPFRLSPDHRFSFGHRSYAEAKAYLEYALYRGEGFITITGGAGTGKTTLISEILSTTDQSRIQIATLNSTQLEGRDLLHMVAASFGLRPHDDSKAGLLLELEQFLVQQSRRGQRCVLIVDEAQGLSPSALEELRLLANLQHHDRLLLQVFLVGQEQLRDIVRAPAMEHLSQRIIAAAHLEPLSLEDTVNYVEHRLSRVRWHGDPKINADALRLLHRYSGGVPRRINLICSRLFLHGALEGKHELTGEDAQSIIEDLQREGLLAKDVPEPPAGETGEALVSLSLPRDPQAAAVSESAAEGAAARPDTASSAAGQASAASSRQSAEARKPPLREAMGHVLAELEELEKSSAKRPRYESAKRPAPAAKATARQAGQPQQRSAARSASRAGGKVAPSKPPVTRKESIISSSWAKLAIFLVLGGLIIAVTNQVFEAKRDDAADTAIKQVDNSASQPVQQPAVGLPQTDQPGTPEMSVGDSGQTAPMTATDLSEASPEPEDEIAEMGGSETARAGETLSSPAAAVSTTSLVETPGDGTETAKQGEIIRAAPDDEVASAPAEPIETPPPAAAAVVVTSPPVERPAPAPSMEVVQPGQAEPPAVASVAEVPSEADAVAADSDVTPQSGLRAEQVRLEREAEQRFSRRLTALEVESERNEPVSAVSSRSVELQQRATPAPVVKGPAPPAVPAAVVAEARPSQPKTALSAVKPAQVSSIPASAPKSAAPRVTASVPKTAVEEVKPSQPKTAVSAAKPAQTGAVPASAPKVAAATVIPAPVVAQAKPAPTETPALRPDQVRTLLLDGGWSSRGKPASLLPSDVTLCRSAGEDLDCWSVPRNIDTKYGEALYKIEATLGNFYWGGKFRVTYRTLVKLAGAPAESGAKTTSDSDDWQVTEHAMDCQLLRQNEVSCRDEQGVTRTYSR